MSDSYVDCPTMEVPTDVVELCALLQCLGFSVKSLDTSDANMSQEGGSRTVVINCQTSGLHVVLEGGAMSCSCPAAEQNSGFWQVSGMSGSKQHDKETGSSILRSLPKLYKEQLTIELHDMIRSIRAVTDSEEPPKVLNKSASMIELANRSTSLVEPREGNKSASVLELGTPEKRNLQIKAETPTRFRSLDTLTLGEGISPQLRPLQNQYLNANAIEYLRVRANAEDARKTSSMIHRQSTYTVGSTRSTPGSVRRRNKTSSPIQAPHVNLLDSLIEAERVAETLRQKLALVIREFTEEKNDSSMCSGLDVSRISVLKATESCKAQFASSPNLSGLGARDDLPSRLKRQESASTSNLAIPTPDSKLSKLRKLSPNFFRMKKKDSEKKDKDVKSSLIKAKIVTPIRPRTTTTPQPSPNFSSASKKKFSHIKSTIPRPTPKKE